MKIVINHFLRLFAALGLLFGAQMASAQTVVNCMTDGNNLACGGAANAGTASVSINAGGASTATDSSVQIGLGNALSGSVSIGIGVSASNESVAIGKTASAGGSGVAIGSAAGTTGGNDVAIGSAARTTGESSVAIGSNANAVGKRSVAIGSGSLANENDTVSIGAGAGGGTGPVSRRLTNLAAGVNDTDGVNLIQMNTAIAAVNTNDATARAAAAAAQGDATTALTGGANDSTARTSAGAAAVAAASAHARADDAHTRLDGVDSTLLNHEDRISALESVGSIDQVARDSASAANNRIDKLDKKAMQGIAAGLAATAAMPAGVDLAPGEVSMNIGVGAYSSQTALAMGWAHRMKSDEPFIRNAIVRGAIAVTGGRAAVSAGIGWKW